MIWQRLRGALGIAVIWAVGWLPLGLLLALYTYWRDGPMDFDQPWPPDHLRRLMLYATGVWLLGGAVAGLLFASVLALAEKGRSVADLKLSRTVLWGALGAAFLPALVLTREALDYAPTDWWMGAAVILGISATLGAGSAAATLALARGSESRRLQP